MSNKYIYVYEDLKNKIERNELTENSKLPSIRQLSLKYGVNNATISRAYDLLEKEGYVVKKQGKGIFVKVQEYLFYNNPSDESVDNFNKGFVNDDNNLSIINFISGTPSDDMYPFEKLKEIVKKIFSKNQASIMNYHSTQGYLALRKEIKKFVERREIFISEKNIQITTGSQQAIDLMLKTLLSKSKNKVVVGNPTYHGALNTFKSNCKIYPITMERDGFNMEELENILATEKISFIYTMMDYSCPTGVSWSEEKRRELIALAEKYSVYIVEDDFASELSYTSNTYTSLKALDIENKYVIYIKSFSKILMPGLRLAFMLLPEELTEKVITTKFNTDISTPGLEQHILLEFLKESLDEHINYLRLTYKKRYEKILEKLQDIPELKMVNSIEGGYYIWLELDEKINPHDFYLKCKKQKIFLLPGNAFFVDNLSTPFFRLSFATTNIKVIEKAFNKFKEIIESLK